MRFLLQILYTFQQCKNFENRLRFDKVTESLKVGTFFETQCRFASFVNHVTTFNDNMNV